MSLIRMSMGLLALALPMSLLTVTSTADAQEIRRGPAYELSLNLDLPILLIAGGMTSSFFFLPELPGVACAPSCDRSEINGLDRPSAGNHDSGWSPVGAIGTAVTMAAPLVVIVIDEGFAKGLNDDLVVAEAALVSSALQSR